MLFFPPTVKSADAIAQVSLLKNISYLFVLILLATCILTAGNHRQQNQSPKEISLISFNIRYGTADDGENSWTKRRDLFMSVLKSHSPDIMGLQEALRFQLDEIKDILPGYGEIGVGRDDGYTKGEYSAILFRTDKFAVSESGTFWFSGTPTLPASKHWGNNVTRICTWARFVEKKSGKGFYLYNVHLDHESQNSREKSAVLLSDHLLQRNYADPVIVTGDFNAGEHNAAIRYLLDDLPVMTKNTTVNKFRLQDTFRTLHPEDKNIGTYHAFNGSTDGDKIDFIFVSESWKVLRSSIDHTNLHGRFPSDHFPVTAIIELQDSTDK